MPAYWIDYTWIYNKHGDEGPPCLDQEIPLRVRYHIQPDEPDVNLHFDITIEEIWNGEHPLSTDANFECGWYQSDEARLLDWLLDGNYADGKPAALAPDNGKPAEGEG